jgi:nitrate/nitrite transporter NarK
MTKKKSKSLEYAVKDGVAHSAMMGMGENYLSPYAIELGASDMQIGFLSSIPKLLGSLSQLFSSKMTEKIASRKTMVLLFGLFQSVIWIPIALLGFSNFSVIWTLILLATVYWFSGSIVVT